MRVNIYSQELLLDDDDEFPVELITQEANTGITYSAVRMILHSSDRLHHPPKDDDRSAITIWLPKSEDKRKRLANILRDMAFQVDNAPPETGLD